MAVAKVNLYYEVGDFVESVKQSLCSVWWRVWRFNFEAQFDKITLSNSEYGWILNAKRMRSNLFDSYWKENVCFFVHLICSVASPADTLRYTIICTIYIRDGSDKILNEGSRRIFEKKIKYK